MNKNLIKVTLLTGGLFTAAFAANYVAAGPVHTFEDNIDFTDPATYTPAWTGITIGKPDPVDGGDFKGDGIYGLFLDSSLFKPDDAVLYTHDISDDGYNKTDYSITDATLYLSFHDDKGVLGGDDGAPELAELDLLGLISGDPLFEVDNTTYPFSIDGLAFLDLAYDGDLHVSVRAEAGDFYLQNSKLVVKADHTAAPVPEPASLALLGLGLAGLVGVRKLKPDQS